MYTANKRSKACINEIWPLAFIRYELQAIKLEKLKRMTMEDEKSSDNNIYEVEMSEAKHGVFIEPPPS